MKITIDYLKEREPFARRSANWVKVGDGYSFSCELWDRAEAARVAINAAFDEALEERVREAVLAERKRCADIARKHGAKVDGHCACMDEIADAILKEPEALSEGAEAFVKPLIEKMDAALEDFERRFAERFPDKWDEYKGGTSGDQDEEK